MRISVVSDLHNEFEVLKHSPPEADVYIIAGDLDLRDRGVQWIKDTYPSDKPIIYIAGNHNAYHSRIDKGHRLIREKLLTLSAPNIHFLENEKIKINDVWFIGMTLWTDFMLLGEGTKMHSQLSARNGMNDYRVISYKNGDGTYTKLNPYHTEHIFRLSKQFLINTLKELKGEKVVVVTHTAPSIKSVEQSYRKDELSPAFASNLEKEIEKYAPVLWVHGHIHTSSDYKIANTRIICNPRGYPHELNKNYNEKLTVRIGEQ